MKESLLQVKLPSPRDASSSTTIRRHSFPMELVHLSKSEVADLDKAQGGAKFKGKYRDYTGLGHKFMDGKFVNGLNKEIRQFHASGGMAKLEKMRKSGRHGDTELAYMPKHVADRMDRMIGGACRNPQTGKREYFLGNLIKSIANAGGTPANGAAPNSTPGANPSAGAATSTPSWMSTLGNAAAGALNGYMQSGGDWKKALAGGAAGGMSGLADQYGGQNSQMINNMINKANQAYQNNQGIMGAIKQGGMAGVNGVADRLGDMGGAAGMAGNMMKTGANAYQNGQGIMGAAQQAGMQGINGAADYMGNMGGMAGMAGNMIKSGANAYQNGQGIMGAAQQAGMTGVNGALDRVSDMGGMYGMAGNAARGAMNSYMQPQQQQSAGAKTNGNSSSQKPPYLGYSMVAESSRPNIQGYNGAGINYGGMPQQQQQKQPQQQQQMPQFSPQQIQQFMQQFMQQQSNPGYGYQ